MQRRQTAGAGWILAGVHGCAASAQAAEPTLDVFTDAQWHTAVIGLSSADLPRRIRHDETLFDPHTGAILSTQRAEFGFDDSGRPALRRCGAATAHRGSSSRRPALPVR